MRLALFLLTASWAATAVGLVDIPEVDEIVKEIKEEFSEYFQTPSPSEAAAPFRVNAIAAAAAATPADPSYWVKDVAHQGLAAFNSNPSAYQVFRNVKDFGAVGDGVTDDTAAINAAISSFSLSNQATKRCGPGTCDSTTTSPAVVYFPAGTYKISTPIIDYYLTQIIGNANNLPVLQATSGFQGLGLIDGDQYQSGGAQGWISTNVFLRQIKNIVLDMTLIAPATAATGIHWPTSQATSLQNVLIKMTASSASQQQGLFIENGSGGWMSDVVITGGLYGMNIGNQQFSMRNITITNAITAISQIWNWGWTYSGFTITNCGTALDMSNGGSTGQQVGSINFIDSTITNCPIFVKTAWTATAQPASGGSLIIENVYVSGVPVAVSGPSGTVYAGPGTGTISSWGQGHSYALTGATATTPTVFQGAFTPAARPGPLLATGTLNYYGKSKPQYAASPAASFLSIRSAGATGNGNTDDTTAVQNAVNSAVASNRILFFDHGVYKVTNTIYFPPGLRVIGESYSKIMAAGSKFTNMASPLAVVQIGKSGESGYFEWSDMIVSTQGAAAGAKLIEWNLKASAGSGMWDVHTQIGGFAGSNLQTDQCLWSNSPSTSCYAAYMSIHITSVATGAYLENCWFWTADHDLDDKADNSTRLSIFTGRGMLVEGNTVWLYATGVEHHALYQYQFINTHFIFSTYMQTETPYYMPTPNALTQPFPLNSSLSDPDYSSLCPSSSLPCDSLGLRISNCQNILVYGAGFYSFFNNYQTTCSDAGQTIDCQGQIVQISSGSDHLWFYGLNTVGTGNMVNIDNTPVAKYSDNVNAYSDTIAKFTYRI